MFKTLGMLAILSVSLAGMAGRSASARDGDFEHLRERAEREGWTFEVSARSAERVPLDQITGTRIFIDSTNGRRFEPSATAILLELPERFDWRDSGAVTPVKYQFPCGSCWAHATTGVLESAILITDGVEEDLSEQWLVSCNRDGFGCDGGGWAYDYYLSRGDLCGDSGAILESFFPYEAIDAECGCPYFGNRYFIEDWGYIGPELGLADTDAMKRAMLEYGPIGAAVYVSPEWEAYAGGVFNYCVEGPLNHLVILVGWDDTAGENGVWIMKNSFGTDWGEEGYMRIEYGCSMVGYAATFAVYNGPVRIDAEPSCGPAPMDVSFAASTGFQAESWWWDFGDGGYDTEQNPTHRYNTAGIYDVTVEISTDEGIRGTTREDMIVVHADTIKGRALFARPGQSVEMIITANNTVPVRYLKIPVEFPSEFGLVFDSFSTAGCRTANFETQEFLHYDPFWGGRFTLKLVSSEMGTTEDLAPGDGAVVRLYFTVPDGAAEDDMAEILLDGYDTYLPEYDSPLAVYRVETVPGSVIVHESCCERVGDVNTDGQVDALDFQYLRDYLHRGDTEPSCLEEADVDGDGEITQGDLACLARFLFSTGNPCRLVDCR